MRTHALLPSLQPHLADAAEFAETLFDYSAAVDETEQPIENGTGIDDGAGLFFPGR